MKKWNKNNVTSVQASDSRGYVKSSISFVRTLENNLSDLEEINSKIEKYKTLLQRAMEEKSHLEAEVQHEDSLRQRIVQLLGDKIQFHVCSMKYSGDAATYCLCGNTNKLITELTSLCDKSTLVAKGNWTIGTIDNVDVRFRRLPPRTDLYIELQILSY